MKQFLALNVTISILNIISAANYPLVKPVEIDAYDLCEGPRWDEKENVLLHVDINGHKVCKLNTSTGVSICEELTDLLTIVHPYANSTGDDLLVTQRNKVVHLNWSTKKYEVLGEVAKELNGRERFNDGKPDANGVLWMGTILEKEGGGIEPGKGNLYKFDGKQFIKYGTGFDLTNGLTWSANNKILWVNDSEGRKIFRFDFDLAKGTATNQTIFVNCVNNTDFKDGEYPDGLTIDANGKLWAALYGGGRVVRINPDTGKVEESIAVGGGPLTTSVAFGGANLDELYVTVAYKNYGPDQRINFPNAGRVHRITAEANVLKGLNYMFRYKP